MRLRLYQGALCCLINICLLLFFNKKKRENESQADKNQRVMVVTRIDENLGCLIQLTPHNSLATQKKVPNVSCISV
jgi:hypothetical protein